MTAQIEMMLGPVDDIPPGEGRNYRIAGELVAVFRTRAGELFATEALCPHKRGPLADGLVGGQTVICPLHSRKFDLATGEMLGAGACRLKTYPVHLDENRRIVLAVALAELAKERST